jgi:hypothetical protein
VRKKVGGKPLQLAPLEPDFPVREPGREEIPKPEVESGDRPVRGRGEAREAFGDLRFAAVQAGQEEMANPIAGDRQIAVGRILDRLESSLCDKAFQGSSGQREQRAYDALASSWDAGQSG